MTTKNQCCLACEATRYSPIDGWCDNPNCKCHQSDSVVEDKIALLKRYLLESYPDPRSEHALCGLLDEIITTLQQTAQQEKEELVREILEEVISTIDFYEKRSGSVITPVFTDVNTGIRQIAKARGISVSDK